MKKYLVMLAVFTVALFVLTALPMQMQAAEEDNTLSTVETATATQTFSTTSSAVVESCTSYQMLDITSGKVEEISVRDYLIGAVCAEMPATFEIEALKAQAVAAHTYAERQHLLEQESPTAELYGADFSNDASLYQAYFTENQARQYYGDSFETSYGKICDAVDAVLPYLLEYDGTPIIAAFCSMSSGVTESAETVWGSAVDYLVSVESIADTEAPRYLETTTFSASDFQEAILEASENAEALSWDTDPSTWVVVEDCSDAGTVLNVQVAGQNFTGQQLRSILSLRSAVFTVDYDAATGSFTFTTKGYGHGVGMSQYGANAMAKDGASFQEILAHYYVGTTLVAVEALV